MVAQEGIYAFVFRLTGRRDVADDLFQETFLALAEAAHAASLWPDSNVRAWLYTVARNAFLDHRRRRRGEGTAPAGDEAASGGAGLAPPAVGDVMLSEIERALLALSVEDRQLLLLIGAEGLERERVAAMLELEPPALRQRVARARARLATALDCGPVKIHFEEKGS